jgi:hypothetical protein
MFRRKNQEAAAQAETPPPAPATPMTSSGGYIVTELPTYHAGKRKVVVYTSDAQGRIVKTYKKG